MSITELRSNNILHAMKSGQKAGKPEEGNDSLDNYIKQAIGKEPVLSFTRPENNHVQWIQLLHALDQQGTNKISKGSKINNIVEGKEDPPNQCNGVSSFAYKMNGVKESFPTIKSSEASVRGTQSASEHMETPKIPEAVVALAQAAAKAKGEPEKYLPGWPLLSPPKAQMQKCDKCSWEFCSPINYRRHIRVHRRSLKVDKDSSKNRDILAAYWDKLSLEEAKEVVSFKNVTLEKVPGPSIIKSLASFIRKPGFPSLPQVYIKAGAALLDVVQARPSRFPMSSQELFSILDDASERTFLCAGPAESLQKFVFDGEAGKIGLEMKNLVACTSFLMEQKLVKAWRAEKDAEALRCEKLLVEEEEAAQKRQADLLEKKRLKKLRQKEQKAKEQTEDDEDSREDAQGSLESLPSSGGTSPLCDSNLEGISDPAQENLEPVHSPKTNEETDSRCHIEYYDVHTDSPSGITDSTSPHNVDHRLQHGNGWRHQNGGRRPASSSQRGGRNGFHLGQVIPQSKSGPVQKQGIHKDQRAASLTNGHKVWTRKTKPDNEVENPNARVLRESRDQSELSENLELLIGSISVTLRESNGWCQGANPSPIEQCAADNQQRHKNSQVKHVKHDSSQSGANKSTVKLWRPVSRHGVRNTPTVQDDKKGAEADMVSGNTDGSQTDNVGPSCASTDDSNITSRMNSSTEQPEDSKGLRLFSSSDAEAFLTQRWKEAIAADHLRLVLSPDSEPPDSFENLDASLNPDILCSAENRLPNTANPKIADLGNITKINIKAKPEKNGRLKYIPKQRNSS